MYVCLCNAVTENDIHCAAARGVDTLEGLSDELNVADCCGCCREAATDCLNMALVTARTAA